MVADDLLAFIEVASELTIDFTDMPFDVAEFYELLEFPAYLAEQAASDARANADNPFEIDMWTLHSGATHALIRIAVVQYRIDRSTACDRPGT